MENYTRFYGLLNRMHQVGNSREELKESLVSQFTGGRTTSLRAMTEREYYTMCHDIERRVPALRSDSDRLLRQRRSAVLHQMQLLGVNTADWAAVDRFCQDARIAGKRFRQISVVELEELIPKLHAIRRKRERESLDN